MKTIRLSQLTFILSLPFVLTACQTLGGMFNQPRAYTPPPSQRLKFIKMEDQ